MVHRLEQLPRDSGAAAAEIIADVKEARTVVDACGVSFCAGNKGNATIGMAREIRELIVASVLRVDALDDGPAGAVGPAAKHVLRAA